METMSIKEAAEALGVHPRHIHRLEERGELRIIRNPAYRKGPVRVVKEDVDAILAKRAQ